MGKHKCHITEWFTHKHILYRTRARLEKWQATAII